MAKQTMEPQTDDELLEQVASSEYKWGWTSDIESDTFLPGLSEDVVRAMVGRYWFRKLALTPFLLPLWRVFFAMASYECIISPSMACTADQRGFGPNPRCDIVISLGQRSNLGRSGERYPKFSRVRDWRVRHAWGIALAAVTPPYPPHASR